MRGTFTGVGEFPAQRASNAENGSIWWRHHGVRISVKLLFIEIIFPRRIFLLFIRLEKKMICMSVLNECYPNQNHTFYSINIVNILILAVYLKLMHGWLITSIAFLDGTLQLYAKLQWRFAELLSKSSQIAKFIGLTWDPPGSCRPQMGPMLAP